MTKGPARAAGIPARFLLVHRDDAVDVAWPPLAGASKVGDVLVLELQDGHVPVVRPPGVQSRLLDRHHYVYRPDSPIRRAECEQVLFDLIAADYELEIDGETNRRTIGRLLDAVSEHCGARPPLKVLDFGCGTGLAATVADRRVFDLTGTDPSDRMLERARARGMDTVPLADLARLGTGWADGVIASFVLHLAVPPAALAAATAPLRNGGVLAANFHKGQGRDVAEKAFRAVGLVPVGRPDGHVVSWTAP